MNPFEQQLTGGQATYIERYSYDPESRSFEMIVFHDPESSRDFRVLRGTGIESYEDTPYEPESDVLESIIGADQSLREDGRLVTFFRTDYHEITVVGGDITLEHRAPGERRDGLPC